MNTYVTAFALLALAAAGYYIANQPAPAPVVVQSPAPPPVIQRVPVKQTVYVRVPAAVPTPAAAQQPEVDPLAAPSDGNHHSMDDLVNDPSARGEQP